MSSRSIKLLTSLLLLALLAGGTAYVAIASDEHGHDHAAEPKAVKADTGDHAHEDEADGHQHGHAEVDEHGHGEEGESHGDATEISDASAAAMKIETFKAGPANVHRTVGLTGKVTLNQNKTAQVRARFAGVVRDVKKSTGERVEAGEVLATVESNESLQVYPIKSPLAGIVIVRNANIGDVVEAEPMFVVADLSQLWAEFFIFSRDLEKVQPGQKIDIISLSDNSSTETTIATLLPLAESSSQTIVARAVIDNPENKWRAGMTVRGNVVLSERQVPLAVKTEAIQRQEGAMVVYVKKGETYEMRKIELGDSDREWTEVLRGLQPGDEYVASNSFVVKADIGKSAAEHAH